MFNTKFSEIEQLAQVAATASADADSRCHSSGYASHANGTTLLVSPTW
jgi:hypothetical protein